MEAKRMKYDDLFSSKECCACGESGSANLDPISGLKFQNKLFLEIIREVVNIKVNYKLKWKQTINFLYFRFHQAHRYARIASKK